jgi:hypothetical protein
MFQDCQLRQLREAVPPLKIATNNFPTHIPLEQEEIKR